MNPDRQQALNYLRAPIKGLWCWAENGAVLVWRDGSTIAFRVEIIQIIEWLAPNGLPSFGAIVFLLAACRGKLPHYIDFVDTPTVPPPLPSSKEGVLLTSARKQLKAQIEDALAQLGKIQQITAELNSGFKAKCVLAEAIFEPAKAERHVEARQVLRGMREIMSDTDLSDPDRTGVRGGYIRQLHLVAEGLRPHTVDSLKLRLQTGLDALPKTQDVKLPISERARQLIDELSRDREYGAVARAARELMAAVRLPRRLGEREQLPIGGVADITNRGTLDRLLLTELAHDDLTLSVRVALNEALYLRREPPMREPPGTLAFLLDSGVRLWGIPRVLGTAVALAMIARDKQHQEVLSWRAHDDQLQSVELLSRNGLTQHLSALETSAHPGSALKAFGESVPPDAQTQAVLITHRDALDDLEFRRALMENSSALGFIAVVDREGRFELHALPLAHRTPLCEAHLDLASVFDTQTGVASIKADANPNLPAILGMRPFPFLLPVTGKMDHWVKAADGFIYTMLNDRRWAKFRDQSSGARVLATDLPAGKTMWMDCAAKMSYAVKAGSLQRPIQLLSFDMGEGTLRVTDLAIGSGLRAVYRYGDAILLIRQHDVRAYALGDGRLLGQITNPHSWLNGRFFRSNHTFYFAVWDGERIKFEPVTLPKSYTPSVISHIFDREGLEGPWLIHQSGLIMSSATGEQLHMPMPPERKYGLGTVQISRNGHRVYSSVCANMLDLTTGKSTSIPASPQQNVELEYYPGMPQWNIYRVIESVGRLRDGLAIFGRKDRGRKLTLNGENKLQIVDIPGLEKHEIQDKLAFSDPPIKTAQGCTLQSIQYPSGSKVFLDSRGLLHFKSCDTNIPEVSLVLSDGEVAGWSSDGHVCGPAFFFDGEYISEPARIFERLMQFLNTL